MKKCQCSTRIEKGEGKEKVFNMCMCSKGCEYCFINNQNCGGMV